MKYLSVCSGIEAATVAWHPLGWEPVGFSEIEPFPSAVLKHHYPNVTNFGDMTKYKEWNIGTDKLDLLVGGTPCQSFSVAGLRKGLDDPRGNLALVYCGMLDHFRPQWFVWENVPGVLSSNGGRDFGSFLGAVAELGYGFAYRVLDAQFFGVAQRRRRVFVVGYLGDWRPPAAVLFERESLRRDTAPSREKRKDITELAGTLAANGGGLNSPAGNANELDFCVVYSEEVAGTLTARGNTSLGAPEVDGGQFLPMYMGNAEGGALDKPCITVQNLGLSNQSPLVGHSMAVRRLTPKECERLQGFPDNYTNIPWRKKEESPDGPRYKALGNSMAVPVMGWIGNRIKMLTTCTK
jgi:DNA (cytosine-5)-methyltransferase 1